MSFAYRGSKLYYISPPSTCEKRAKMAILKNAIVGGDDDSAATIKLCIDQVIVKVDRFAPFDSAD